MLKNCPFCNGIAGFKRPSEGDEATKWRVKCQRCGASVGVDIVGITTEDIVKNELERKWNQRFWRDVEDTKELDAIYVAVKSYTERNNEIEERLRHIEYEMCFKIDAPIHGVKTTADVEKELELLRLEKKRGKEK